jgi:hypothetical protein
VADTTTPSTPSSTAPAELSGDMCAVASVSAGSSASAAAVRSGVEVSASSSTS